MKITIKQIFNNIIYFGFYIPYWKLENIVGSILYFLMTRKINDKLYQIYKKKDRFSIRYEIRKKLGQLKIEFNPYSSTKYELNCIKKDREKYAKDIIQPYTNKGNINKDYLKVYGNSYFKNEKKMNDKQIKQLSNY